MKIHVTDRESIERGIRVRSSYVVISIRDPEKPKAKVRKQSGLRAILYVAFHDAEPATGMTLPPGIVLMTRDHAIEIWKFVEKWKDRVGAIVVHCEQGMSRSPAVALAICDSYKFKTADIRKKSQPNMFVSAILKSYIH
jgi:predicted protein tyrosine phosphatase